MKFPSIRRVRALKVRRSVSGAAALLLAPGLALAIYQRQFSYDWRIVVFGEAIVVSALALTGLLSIGVMACLPPNRARAGAIGLAFLPATILVAVWLIDVGAFVSNSVWGDTLTLGMVRTFSAYSNVAVDFLPISPARRSQVFFGAAAFLIVSSAFVAAITVLVSSKWLRTAYAWAERGPGFRGRLLRLARGLGAAAVVSSAIGAILLSLAPRALYGEPVTAFLELTRATRLMSFDNGRLAAAIKDGEARRAYRKPADFKPRNVIVIVADALRADRMGVYGYSRDTTPFLSELYSRRQLHRVDMALSTCSETFCGVASLLASHPFHQLSSRSFKLHSLLHDVGYRVKFFLSGDHRTWSYLLGFYGADVDDIYDFATLHADDINDDRNIVRALESAPPATDEQNFLYIHLMSSHVSGTKFPAFEKFQPAFSDSMRLFTFWNELAGTQRLSKGVTTGRLREEDLEAVSNRYDNGVLQTDDMIRTIFDLLQSKSYLQNSIVVITGDHGDGLGEHGHIGHTRYLYQEDIHIPLLIFDSDVSVYRNGAFAAQIDIAPTIVDRLGLPIPSSWQGRSLLEPPTDRVTLHQTRRGLTPCFAVVERSESALMKYLRCGAASNLDEALFDVVKDPEEKDNLAPTAGAAQLDRYRALLEDKSDVFANACRSAECRD